MKNNNLAMISGTQNNQPYFSGSITHRPPVLLQNLKKSHLIHSPMADLKMHYKDPTRMWEFWSLNPESLRQVMILMSDHGTPFSYRRLPGFMSHLVKGQDNNAPFKQSGEMYRHSMNIRQRKNLVTNIVRSMSAVSGVKKDDIIYQQMINFYRADHQLGLAVAKGMGVGFASTSTIRMD